MTWQHVACIALACLVVVAGFVFNRCSDANQLAIAIVAGALGHAHGYAGSMARPKQEEITVNEKVRQ